MRNTLRHLPITLAVALTTAACSSSTTQTAPARIQPAAAQPPTTSGPIKASDLRTWLYAYADDSMMGREAGTMGNYRATDFIAREAQRIGLEPAGDDGTYFQMVPMKTRTITASLTLNGETLAFPSDVLPLPPIEGIPVATQGTVEGVPVIYGGPAGTPQQIEAAEGEGKVVVISAIMGPEGPAFNIPFPTLLKFQRAAALVVVNLDIAPGDLVAFLSEPSAFVDDGSGNQSSGRPLMFFASDRVGEMLFGMPMDSVEVGAAGQSFGGTIGFTDQDPESPARNVVGILRGSDPALRSEFIAIGAHSDHVGTASTALDHDSLRAYLEVVRPRGAEDAEREANTQEAARIQEIIADLRTRNTPRLDSIFNGADDDGSGTVTTLAIAQALASAQLKPRRSIIFVWHVAEEKGLFGAQHFTDNPSVPRDQIVAQLNMDMIGRGADDDVPLGGPGYLQLIGSRRLSTELGDLVEAVNTEENHDFIFDYQYDADGHPDNFYCRSDHYMYARHGIPIVFFSTGGHRDYHQLTDEPQYINYDKMARVGRLVQSVAERVANLDHRVVVDKPKPNPNAPCQQ